MRSICFYFQVHQPYRLRTYRFFDIGNNSYYYDDFQNRTIIRRVADKCYLPANSLMLDIINKYGTSFKISYSISGTALDQFEMYTPDVIESFKKLVDTGCVEILSETYSHSLSSLVSREEFVLQVEQHKEKIRRIFGIEPVTFRNTELIYSDHIGEIVADMGFRTMLTEGAKHVLGWKSPNYMYCNAINPKLKLLLKNFQLSDDIAFRFSQQSWSEWPLTTEKFVGWLNEIDAKQEVVNLFMDYETFGEHQWPETGIFEFMKVLPERVFKTTNYTFNTPSELAEKLQPVSAIHVPNPISWADEERDLTAWLGNELQDEAFEKLYSIESNIRQINDPEILKDWRYLQTSDHYYYMCTKWFSDGDVHKYFNPYGTPYEAFINFMNVFSDFQIRVINYLKNNHPKENNKAKQGNKSLQKKRKYTKAKQTLSIGDLEDLSDSKIKQIIKAVDNITLVFVLKDADVNLRKRFFDLMGKKALNQFKNFDNETVNPRKSDLQNSKKKFEGIIKKLF